MLSLYTCVHTVSLYCTLIVHQMANNAVQLQMWYVVADCDTLTCFTVCGSLNSSIQVSSITGHYYNKVCFFV